MSFTRERPAAGDDVSRNATNAAAVEQHADGAKRADGAAGEQEGGVVFGPQS